MYVTAIQEPSALSRWTSRTAVFAVLLLMTAFILHRLFGMPTPVAFNLVAAAYLGALAACIMGLLAAVEIWQRGGAGTARVVAGMLIGAVMLGAAASAVVLGREFPPINDISTDTRNPPSFDALAKDRGLDANPVDYPGAEFASTQSQAYPDLRPIEIARPVDDVFAIVAEVVKRARMTVAKSSPPDDATGEGTLEAVDRTLIAGFYDDVVIRVSGGGGERARIDIRSASRFGTYDYGRNVERVRGLIRDIGMRLAATIPGNAAKEIKNGAKPGAKPGKDADAKTEGRRKQRDRER